MGRLAAAVETHPRMHFTGGDIPELKEKVAGTHAFYYEKLLECANDFVRRRLPRTLSGAVGDRLYGDMLPVLAMAFLLSGDRRYLKSCRRGIELILATERWGDDLDLVTGHFMAGVAIAYDWLYDHLGAPLRREIDNKLSHHASVIVEYASAGRIWWHDMFLQNWSHVIIGALACAGAALYGENDAAAEWVDYADAYFTKVTRALPDDGSYQEGQAYLTYALEMLVRYWDLAKGLFGRDHFGCRWIREVPYFLLYFSTPRPRPGDNCMVFGDGPRNFEWHGPVHLLFRLADEYGDSVVQGFAARLAAAGIGLTRMGAWANMLWYNPALAEKGVEHLPTFRFFEEIDTVSMRSGWDEDAVLVGFTCTNSMLRKTQKLYPGRDLGSGHAQPDAAGFQVYAFGEWLAIHPGYTHYKTSADHNTFLVNNAEQLGGDRTWFDVLETQEGPCEIDRVITTDEFDYARADASGIYRKPARLERFIRHMVFIKPADILVVDELAAEVKSKFEWCLHAEEEIVGIGGHFHVRKNDARMRVAFLAPDDLVKKISSHKVEGASHTAPRRTVMLSARPAKKTRGALFVTLLSVYRGAGPGTEPENAVVEDGTVTLDLTGEGARRTLRLDLAEGRVTLT